MESKEITIASLVLGYLKNEKCRSSYKEFLRSSRHLQHLNSISRSKYIPTRFVGLTLEDILREYFDMYRVIQGRLETTNYFNECHPKASLVDQLIYLLNFINSSRVSTPRSTPCPRSPGDSHLNASSPSCTDQISDIETTSVHNLPGNKHSTEEAYHKTSRRSKENSFNTITSTENDKDPDIVVNSEVLAQTLLENKEFHEKIAQTINKVAEKQSKESAELDETIKTVVKETEEDPIFDRILEEIIGSAGIVDSEINNAVVNDNQKPSEECIKTKHKPETKENRCDSASQTRKTDEVIVFDGSLDKYLVSNLYSVNTQTIPAANPLYINTANNLLVLPSSVTANMATAVSNPQQYYFINKPPAVSCIIPPTILTEQDILSMPTVIVNDDRPRKSHVLKKTGKPPVLKPKGQIEVSTNVDIREFIRTYGPDEPQEPPKIGLKNVRYPKTAAPNLSEDVQPNTTNCQTFDKENVTHNSAATNTNDFEVYSTANSEIKETSTKTDKTIETTDSVELKDKNNKTGESKDVLDLNIIDLNTPVPLELAKKSTPKSGSHVRNLDFSTPPKISSSAKKSLQENQNNKKSSTPKKQAVKSLFKKNPKAAKPIWDADLRSTVIPEETTKRESSKRKKKTSPIKSKKKPRMQKNEKVHLNTTEQDGALLEAALKTPIKNDIGKEALDKSESTDTNKNDHREQPENIEGVKSKTILSPSKLNANKRTFVNTESEVDEKNKFVTPESVNDKHTCAPLKANRNITPMLETPIKDLIVPKTPRILTPAQTSATPLNNITPFTKMLEANLKGIDIDSIPTPSIPITPNFPPFTPNVDLGSPYSNRPTDYSTSSSYYQPSDSEQNKYLENRLLEIEKAPAKAALETNQGKLLTTSEHLDIFNKNVIGKKNLNLMKKSKPSSSSESNSNSESSDEDDETDESFNQEANDTVVFKKKVAETPRRVYSLRVRSVTNYKNSGTTANETEKKTAAVKLNRKQKTKQVKLENKKSAAPKKSNEEPPPEHHQIKALLNDSKEILTTEKLSNESSKEQPTELVKELQSIEQFTELTKEQQRTDLITEQKAVELTEKHCVVYIEEIDTKSDYLNAIQKDAQALSTAPDKGKCNKKEKSPLNVGNTNKKKDNRKQQNSKEMYIKGKLASSQQAVLKELEEKRKRTLKKIKTANTEPPAKKVKNGKFKIKPIPDVSGRKRPRKSDSPRKNCHVNNEPISSIDMNILKQDLNNSDDSDDDVSLHLTLSDDDEVSSKSDSKSPGKLDKSSTDVEAQTLIEGLKERGIHLMQNRLQKMKDPGSEDVDENGMTAEASESVEHNAIHKNISDSNVQMNSSAEMTYICKEKLDIKTFEGEYVHLIFNENCKSFRTLESFDIQELSKSYMAKLYIEEIDQDVDIPIKCTQFCCLFELNLSNETDSTKDNSPRNNSNNENFKNTKEKQGKSTLDNPKGTTIDKRQEDLTDLQLSKSTKDDHKDKKCEKLLKHLNVDSFLNKMYDT